MRNPGMKLTSGAPPAATHRICAVLLAAASLAAWSDAQSYALRGSVLANGGGTTAGSGRRMLATAGQPVIGSSSGGGRILCSGFWCFGGSRVVSVPSDDKTPPIPGLFWLGRAVPNPARENVTFTVALPRPADIGIVISDIAGRLVCVLTTGRMEQGVQKLSWNLLTRNGAAAPEGIYFVTFRVDGRQVQQRRFVLVN